MVRTTQSIAPQLHRHVRPCIAGCGELVLWTITQRGARLAVDPVPDDKGNQAVQRDHHGSFRSRVPNDEWPLILGLEQLYMPHAATCSRGDAAARAQRAGIAAGNVVDLTAARARRQPMWRI